MLLRRGEDEDDIRGGLLQRLEEGIEGLCGEHVHLVDDEDLVAAHLRGDACLLCQLAHAFNAVVARGVQLEDVQ